MCIYVSIGKMRRLAVITHEIIITNNFTLSFLRAKYILGIPNKVPLNTLLYEQLFVTLTH